MERRPEKPEPLAEPLVSFLVVGKLFVVDLIGIEGIWRVLLFLGFGGLFPALSYYLRSLGHPNSETLATPNALCIVFREVIHNMLWIKARRWWISASRVTRV